jgi:muramidase (phage lysozyme)
MRIVSHLWYTLLTLGFAASNVQANNVSLIQNGFFAQRASFNDTPPIVSDRPSLAQPSGADVSRGAVALRPGAASLFRGRASGGLFSPERVQILPSAAKQLMTLIAGAEAGEAGYDAVQHGARTRPAGRPTEMTIAEIYQWIDDTPGQPHAIGRYQLIPATLRRLVRHQEVPHSKIFSPELQDQLAPQLLEEAGLSDFLAAEMPGGDFMLNLAKIWAGLPTSNGKSYYEGYAGNSAVYTWDYFDTHFRKIFPG